MTNDPNDNSPLTVLVIEDHPDQRDLLAIVLQREGYRVITAANGLEALEKLETEHVHIALSDIMMPKMDGFEACKTLKQQEETRTIPVVFLSAKGQEAEIKKGFEVGAEAYFLKPFTPDELPQRLIPILTKYGKI